jgi:fructokinase
VGDLGTVELGGTKCLATSGSIDGTWEPPVRIDTSGKPGDTVDQIVTVLKASQVKAVGLAAFGPLELRSNHPSFGHIGATPKSGWSDFDLLGEVRSGVGVPTGIDTDVNAAARAEGRWGATSDVEDHTYITVGTGIGFGLIVAGLPISHSSHPELGHIAVERHTSDDFAGICPFHGACLEGMASGAALEARFGELAENLRGSAEEEASDLASYYVAQGVRVLAYTYAPRRVVVGGGVSHMASFHRRVADHFISSLGGYEVRDDYLQDDYIVKPGLGDFSGLAGGLIIASGASHT